jgi:hypothetical protein
MAWRDMVSDMAFLESAIDLESAAACTVQVDLVGLR